MAAIHAGIHQICDFSFPLQATLLFRRSARACAVEKVFFVLLDDVLVAHTDGITEAENRQHELWGQPSLEALLKSCSRKSPKEIINAILEQVSTFASGQPQRDDETLLVMRVEAGCDD